MHRDIVKKMSEEWMRLLQSSCKVPCIMSTHARFCRSMCVQLRPPKDADHTVSIPSTSRSGSATYATWTLWVLVEKVHTVQE